MASDRRLLTLLGVVAAAAATVPALAELPPVVQFLLLAAGCGGLLAEWRNWRLSPLLLTLIALGGTIFGLSRFSWGNPVSSFLTIAAILLAIRLLTEKSRRNTLQLFGLALFNLAASSLIRLDALFFISLLILAICSLTALVLLTASELPLKDACPPAVTKRLLLTGLLLTVSAVPLMGGFFLVLPRTQMPVWRFFPEGGSSSGFAEQVQPGRSSSQQSSGRVAFRAEVSAPLPADRLYWRATVLNTLSGGTWRRTPPEWSAEPQRGSRDEVGQTIYLEPGLGRHLVGLDLPATITGIRHSLAADAVITSASAGSNRLRYQVTSRPGATLVLPPGADLAPYLALPPDSAPQLVSLGHKLRLQGDEPAELLQQVEALFIRQQLRYATSGMATTPTPLDDFFFAVRQGNCEFFAGAAAILLRAAGVPTRLVGGYLGGDYQPLGGFYTVTDERAHVWVEALVEDRWQRLDPSRWAVNGAELARPARKNFRQRVLQYADLIDYYWTRTVVTFDFQQQFTAADRSATAIARALSREQLRRLLPWLAGGGLLVTTYLLCRRLRIPSREERFLRLLQRRLGRGPLPPAACLLEIAREITDHRLQTAIRHYAATIYQGRHLSVTRYRRLRKMLSR